MRGIRVIGGRYTAAALCAALLSAVAWLLGAAGARAAETVTRTFSPAGGEQSWVVPAGVTTVGIRAVGGRGENGGEAAEVTGQIAVTPGHTLYLEVGGNGSGFKGGFNGGGAGGTLQAGGGGGATDVRAISRQGAGTLGSRVLVAAGSGGGGSSGLSGGAAGGEGEDEGEFEAGEPGTQTGGGSQGVIFECEGKLTRATDGAAGTGGEGGECHATHSPESAGGGGGGAGLYGGGGGGVYFRVDEASIGAGGGGGSSLVPSGGSVTLAAPSAEPVIELSYGNPELAPVAVTQTPSPLGAHEATLHASVSPADSAVTTCEFEYGTSVFYEHSVPCTPLPGAGDQPVAVEAPIEGLIASTTYHFRIVAANTYGTTDSADAEFVSGPHEPPSVSEYTPQAGPQRGKNTVTITGTEMDFVTEVAFEGQHVSTPGTGLKHLSPTMVSVVVPESIEERTIVLHDDLGDEVAVGKYRFVPTPSIRKLSVKKGTTAGGTTVVITGTGLTDVTEVLFGGVPGAVQPGASYFTLTVITPAHAVGKFNVAATSVGGTSQVTNKATYQFAGLELTAVSPPSGPRAGGATVTVTGSGFAPGAGTTAFVFGKAAATGIECASTTQCTMTTPAGARAGSVDVRASIVGGKGKSKKSAADRYTYE